MNKKNEIRNLIIISVYLLILILIKLFILKEIPSILYGLLCFMLTFLLTIIGGTIYLLWENLDLNEKLKEKSLFIKILIILGLIPISIIIILIFGYLYKIVNNEYHLFD